MPLQALGIGRRGRGLAQHVRQAAEQLGLALGRIARFKGVVMVGHDWSLKVRADCAPPLTCYQAVLAMLLKELNG